MVLESGEKEEGGSDRRLFIEYAVSLIVWGLYHFFLHSLRIEMNGTYRTHLTAPLQTLEIASIESRFASGRKPVPSLAP